jgi:hypothetical protein
MAGTPGHSSAAVALLGAVRRDGGDAAPPEALAEHPIRPALYTSTKGVAAKAIQVIVRNVSGLELAFAMVALNA